MPATVGIAAHHIDRTQAARPVAAAAAVGKHGEFVWHGDDDAVDIAREGHTFKPLFQVLGSDLGGDANCVFAMLLKRLGDAKRGLYLGNWVAHDDVNAGGSAEVIKHM